MNGKQAKKLRKEAGYTSKSKTYYVEGKPSGWGPVPKVKSEAGIEFTHLIDYKKLKKVLQNTKNPKFKGFSFNKILRYIPGIPIKLEDCPRKKYKELKKNYVEVAQGAN